MIQLTREEAEYVLGASPSNPDSILEPLPLKDGNYHLEESAIFDPANADIKDYLAGKVVQGGPTEEQAFDLGTDDEPNEEEQELYDNMKLTISDPERTTRGTPARAADVGVTVRDEPDAGDEPETDNDDDMDDEDKEILAAATKSKGGPKKKK